MREGSAGWEADEADEPEREADSELTEEIEEASEASSWEQEEREREGAEADELTDKGEAKAGETERAGEIIMLAPEPKAQWEKGRDRGTGRRRSASVRIVGSL
jgi:hypothetical protein